MHGAKQRNSAIGNNRSYAGSKTDHAEHHPQPVQPQHHSGIISPDALPIRAVYSYDRMGIVILRDRYVVQEQGHRVTLNHDRNLSSVCHVCKSGVVSRCADSRAGNRSRRHGGRSDGNPDPVDAEIITQNLYIFFIPY